MESDVTATQRPGLADAKSLGGRDLAATWIEDRGGSGTFPMFRPEPPRRSSTVTSRMFSFFLGPRFRERRGGGNYVRVQVLTKRGGGRARSRKQAPPGPPVSRIGLPAASRATSPFARGGGPGVLLNRRRWRRGVGTRRDPTPGTNAALVDGRERSAHRLRAPTAYRGATGLGLPAPGRSGTRSTVAVVSLPGGEHSGGAQNLCGWLKRRLKYGGIGGTESCRPTWHVF